VVEYLRAYQALTDSIAADLRMPVIHIDAQHGAVAAVARIADALDLAPFTPPSTNVSSLAAYTGRYRRTDADNRCAIVTDGEHLYVEGSPNTRLVQRTAQCFDVLGTCVRFAFQEGEVGRMDRLECRGNWSGLAPSWVREE
jgi:hypothetical protein